MPHLTCVDAKIDSIRSLLDEYKSRGIENIMALRGDPPEAQELALEANLGDFRYALDLVKFIKAALSFRNLCVSKESSINFRGS